MPHHHTISPAHAASARADAAARSRRLLPDALRSGELLSKGRLALVAMLLPLLLAACSAASTPPVVVGKPALIPAPASLQTLDGHFTVDARTRVRAGDEVARRVAGQFIEFVAVSNDLHLDIAGDGSDADGIRFRIDPQAAASPEGYTLDITPTGVDVRASDERGLFYGAVTLWQLLSQADGAVVQLPALKIDDAPRFGWRGFMLDSARHFQSVEEIKQLLDTMALHKLNVFHWHLTDDQGWRVEIKRYPRLTGIGGCRIPAGDGGVDPATGKPVPYCGFYTQAQIRDVVAHAAALHISIVPEFDVPGHATAAIAAYPELGTIDTPLVPSNEWGVFPNLFNAEDDTAVFLENVLAEIVELFPGRYVHIGGDEAVKDQWEASARVQQRMRERGAKTEMDLQGLLVTRLEKFLASHDRRLIGWDEILEAELPASATVMSWRGTEGGLTAARQGHDVVMSPSSHLYLDYLQTDSPNEPPGRPAMVSLEKLYGFEPVPAELEASQRGHILGVQANLWTEHTRTFARLQHHMFPRLAALAETGWSPTAKRNYADFLTRLPAQLHRYTATGIAFAQTPFEVIADAIDDRKAGTVAVTLRNPLGYAVHYTTDGSEPLATSPQYTQPLQLPLPAKVNAAAFFDGAPLVPATHHVFNADRLLTRHNAQFATCPDTGRLLLRLEDDGPLEGERAIFNVTIFYPCWSWPQADLDGITGLKIRAGRMPYYFQLAHDEPNRRFLPARSTHGELLVQTGSCTGPTVATLPLPAATDADGFITLDAPLPANSGGKTDLCFTFTGDTRPAMWVLDRVTLEPRNR
ncbi:family 20 glycosylhydrolase [Luteimonas sp. RIT-PG2_3]